MPEQLLTILKFCLLALLYLFFLRAMRAVWAEVNGPKLPLPGRRAKATAPGVVAKPRPEQGRRRKRKAVSALTIVEPPELVGRRYDLAQELSIGRAANCQVTLDDTYASQMHCRVFQRDGECFLEDLGSTNGTYLNRNKVAGQMVISAGDHIQIGSTVLELA